MTTLDKRQHPRVLCKGWVSYPELRGNRRERTFDISRSGVFVLTENPMPRNARPTFLLALDEDQAKYRCRGEVVRHGRQKDKDGMGLRFLDIPDELLSLIDHRSGDTQRLAEHRKAPRHEFRVKVQFASLNDFAVEYTKNLSKGGLFFETGADCIKDQLIPFTLVLPGLNLELQCTGKVVYLSPRPNGNKGVGIQFVDYADEFKPRLEQFFQWCQRHHQV
ncbi:MAG: hypothetical protein A2284_14285 [Deltaproteobacteria bacterium RIFOXYA12_FULL_61_11]|nr:MAG: hypothetical protein A2284_14285 [Deltaproteobacteria bacterium RIFOXYA12_FULL_61_11]